MPARSRDRVTDRSGRSWRVAQRRVLADADRAPGPERPTDTSEGKSYHEEIVLAAFGSLDETEATLATLGWFLVGISTLVWALAALCARWLSRKTLVPLTRLVDSVRSLDAANPGWTLAEVGTRDELDDLRRAFNDLLARLHEAYDRQRRFSSEASHQLRTPVAVMIGHLEVAQRYERSGEEYRRVIQLAHQRAVDLGQIVESFLFLSRADSATLTRSEPLDLGRWLIAHMENRPANRRSAISSSTCPGRWPCGSRPSRTCSVSWSRTCWTTPASTAGPGRRSWSAARARRMRPALGRGLGLRDRARGPAPGLRAVLPLVADLRRAGPRLRARPVRRPAGSPTAFGGTVAVASELGRGSRFEVRSPAELSRPGCADVRPASRVKSSFTLAGRVLPAADSRRRRRVTPPAGTRLS